MKSGIVVVSMLLTAAFGPVIAAQSSFTDPVDLLHAVAKSYADGVESFHIESVTETVRNSEFEQDRQVSYQTAIKDTGNHYRIETRSAFGSWVLDSDGTTEWLYLVELNKYSKHPLPDNWPQFPMGIGSSFDLQNAWAMRPWLEGEASSYKHATMLPPETIVIEGHSFDCYVVHVTSDDDTRRRDPERSYSTTYWIDRQALVFRKKVQHDAGYVMMTQKLHLPQRSDVTVMYPIVDLHPQTTGQMFVFTPPAGAAEVASFESDFPAPPQFQAGMLGKPAPDITFTAADGRKVALSSYRGKPVLLDLWATWCGPCLLAMPTLGHLYAEFKDKGLAVITVDQDQTTESAIAYLARHNYSWTNYHDPGNKVGHALQDRMVPLTVLINAQGKIVYYDQGGKEADVRKAIASLGTDFASAARASQ